VSLEDVSDSSFCFLAVALPMSLLPCVADAKPVTKKAYNQILFCSNCLRLYQWRRCWPSRLRT